MHKNYKIVWGDLWYFEVKVQKKLAVGISTGLISENKEVIETSALIFCPTREIEAYPYWEAYCFGSFIGRSCSLAVEVGDSDLQSRINQETWGTEDNFPAGREHVKGSLGVSPISRAFKRVS